MRAQKIAKAMKKHPELFFEIERRLIRFINFREAYTIIWEAEVYMTSRAVVFIAKIIVKSGCFNCK